MRKVIVDSKFDRKSLNSFLSFCFPNLKQNMFFKALRQKDIKVNGVRVKENIDVNAQPSAHSLKRERRFPKETRLSVYN